MGLKEPVRMLANSPAEFSFLTILQLQENDIVAWVSSGWKCRNLV